MIESQTYSATVKASLHVDGDTLNVAQLGPDFCIVREPRNYPPTNARIELTIDGRAETHDVFLTDGISEGCNEVRFASNNEATCDTP
ncbi:MAG: hypothetical protein O3C40_25705 [Planctomycetota bacterium]|nr:hypothetical protein [Planctomycetota bacterium]